VAVQSLTSWIRSYFFRADVSMFFDFVPAPYGGANQFLHALWSELARRGLRLENNSISRTTRACLYNSYNFKASRLRRLKRSECRMVHRVDGPIGVYRADESAIDKEIWALNQEFADATVFQSRYSLEKHRELNLEFKNPTVIPNAVDPAIFHGAGREPFDPLRKIRLISTSWSANPHKGSGVYAWLGVHLDPRRFEYTFVGRSPVPLEGVNVIPPVDSSTLASLLRHHDIYITASRNDPCSNALLEALSCGLPAIYLDSGGHRDLVGQAGLAFTDVEAVPALLDVLVGDYESYRTQLSVPAIRDVASRYLAVMGLST
jgi:glycosyltransferase involved in cell wall biosynthesis